MRKDNIKTYIDNKVKQGKDDISKVNSLIEIYLEGYIHGALLEANELKDEYKEHEEEMKEILKEFKEQSKEAIKNNTYSLDEETIKDIIDIYIDMIILDETCTEGHLRTIALNELKN